MSSVVTSFGPLLQEKKTQVYARNKVRMTLFSTSKYYDYKNMLPTGPFGSLLIGILAKLKNLSNFRIFSEFVSNSL